MKPTLAGHQKPRKQDSHSSLFARPARVPTVPEGHGVGAGLPLAHLVKVRVRASF